MADWHRGATLMALCSLGSCTQRDQALRFHPHFARRVLMRGATRALTSHADHPRSRLPIVRGRSLVHVCACVRVRARARVSCCFKTLIVKNLLSSNQITGSIVYLITRTHMCTRFRMLL